MKNFFAAAMRKAAGLTRASQVIEATRVIQNALSARRPPNADNDGDSAGVAQPLLAPTLRLAAPSGEKATVPQDTAPPPLEPGVARSATGMRLPDGQQRLRKPLGDVLQLLRMGRRVTQASPPLPGQPPRMPKAGVPAPCPEGAQFLQQSFTCPAGARNYMLYVPASAPRGPRGLVMMLHGCKQNPQDFAAGTNMNAVAEAHGLLVAYPAQPASANAMACWNWFNPADQTRGAGEPAIIAGLTQKLMADYGLERECVFVAGLSAGGAMAAVMGETCPDLFAAVGIHSGLAYGSANDVMSAFAVMRGDSGLAPKAKPRSGKRQAQDVRMIVFQGSADQTVHASNAEKIVAAASAEMVNVSVEKAGGRSPGGHSYSRTVITGRDGAPAIEYWLVEGAGHAWSGGDPGGSYTDPQGPDASAEMVRFFLAARPGGALSGSEREAFDQGRFKPQP